MAGEARRIRGPKSGLHKRSQDALAEARELLRREAGGGTLVGGLSESTWPEQGMFRAQAIGNFSNARNRRPRI